MLWRCKPKKSLLSRKDARATAFSRHLPTDSRAQCRCRQRSAAYVLWLVSLLSVKTLQLDSHLRCYSKITTVTISPQPPIHVQRPPFRRYKCKFQTFLLLPVCCNLGWLALTTSSPLQTTSGSLLPPLDGIVVLSLKHTAICGLVAHMTRVFFHRVLRYSSLGSPTSSTLQPLSLIWSY